MRRELSLGGGKTSTVGGDLAPRLGGEARILEKPLVIREEAEHLVVSLRGMPGGGEPVCLGRRGCQGECGRDEQQHDSADAYP